MKTKNIINYDQPKNIYLPYTELLTNNKNISLGYPICKYNDEKIYSTVSGTIVCDAEVIYKNNITKSLKIENDYKDNKIEITKSKKTFNIENEEVIKALTKFNIALNNEENILLNIRYIKKYDESDYLLLKEYTPEILYALDKIASAYNLDNVYILLNKKDKLSKQELYEYIGTYPNIKIIYKDIDNTKIYYLEDIMKFYNEIKYDVQSRYIYFTINNKKTTYLVKAKKYINIKGILEHMNITYNNITDIENNTLEDITVLDGSIRTIIVR